ncbi:hypothetical protein F4809DRAFT_611269 [Biscogniauxia mediterranea]|nr:hypothetical protein F4809DRAFT_611269 [Biscogniauxia mediterranea]
MGYLVAEVVDSGQRREHPTSPSLFHFSFLSFFFFFFPFFSSLFIICLGIKPERRRKALEGHHHQHADAYFFYFFYFLSVFPFPLLSHFLFQSSGWKGLRRDRIR